MLELPASVDTQLFHYITGGIRARYQIHRPRSCWLVVGTIRIDPGGDRVAARVGIVRNDDSVVGCVQPHSLPNFSSDVCRGTIEYELGGIGKVVIRRSMIRGVIRASGIGNTIFMARDGKGKLVFKRPVTIWQH